MNRAVGFRLWFSLLAVAACLATWLLFGWTAAGQALPPPSRLLSAEPMPNERVTISPERLVLTVAVPVDPASVQMRLLGAGGAEMRLEPAVVDPDAPARLAARVAEPLGSGSYIVVWSARAAADGALMAGAYPFAAGDSGPPGSAAGPDQWPAPWAAILRWMVFLGTAVAGGGFVWGRVLFGRPGRRDPGRRPRLGGMAGAAFGALLAAAAAPLLGWVFGGDDPSFTFLAVMGAMPIGWRLQIVALASLTLLCLAALVRGNAAGRERGVFEWLGVGTAGAALAGLGLSRHAAAPGSAAALALELAHLWAAALWVSGVVFFLATWRGLGTDVARFRTVRWMGGVLLAAAVVSGAVRAAALFPVVGDVVASRFGQALAVKIAIVLAVIILVGVTMLGAGRANAVQSSRFLGAQVVGAGLAALLSAVLALLAPPGMGTPTTLAGVGLAEIVPLDQGAFDAERGIMHLLLQPAEPGAQTLVVRLTDADGAPLTADAAPAVEVSLLPLDEEAQPAEAVVLRADASGAIFTGAATLAAGWQQAEVTITPRGGIASRGRFWLVVPDPNVTGAGLIVDSDAEATALYERGLESLTGVRSVRYTQRVGDGSDDVIRTEVSVSAAEGERPAAYAETVIAVDGGGQARQTMIGNRRWVLEDGAWSAAEPMPFLTPAAWGEMYAGATGFQLGPREAIDGELSQVVTFRTPAGGDPAREPAWHAWWVGLASGQVRREAMVSTRQYVVREFRDFNAELGIVPPVVNRTPSDATTATEGTPEATPAEGDDVTTNN